MLLPKELSGVDEVCQRSLGLRPLTGLKTAVRIDPELVWCEVANEALEKVHKNS